MEHFLLNRNTQIIVDEKNHPMMHAKRILHRDMDAWLTEEGNKNIIRLVFDQTIMAEGYHAIVSSGEVSIAYSDELGAVYGLLFISERFIGAKPLGFWNDQPVLRRPRAEIPCGVYLSPIYAVRFRTWMINDEILLDGWKDTHENELAMWERIFETILRCGGNMVIPGTDRKTDELAFLASDMGLWLTQHHTELLNARMFARVYPDLAPSYVQHPSLFEGLWKEAIDKYANRRVLWAVGYRGQGDYAFWHLDKGFDSDVARGEMILRVIKRQMELVREKSPQAVFCTNLYGEMMGLYRKDCLRVPEEVIKLWGDNGYGKMVSRRQGNDNPRVPSMPSDQEYGANGLYYHISFYDLQAANHITASQNPPQMIADELGQAVKNGATACWVINVGSIKPHVYMLDLVREIWTKGSADVHAHAASYAQAYYGRQEIAALLTGYAEHTIAYGPHADDRAGDQYYHFPLRAIACALLRGETEACIDSLRWATGNVPFATQISTLLRICESGVEGWKRYLRECHQAETSLAMSGARLLHDSQILQATLHLTGCEGVRDFCRGCLHLLEGRHVDAYLYVNRALQANRKGVQAMKEAEHGEFVNIYRNECFSNVRLTVRVLKVVRAYIRACHDGEFFYNWEKKYLTPREDTLVMCLTHRTNQLDDDTLCQRLEKVLSLD